MSDTRHIATQDIYAAPGVLAYRKGSEVPASAVENLDCKDKVATEHPKAQSAAKGAAKE
ncbi:hypothetical protein JOF56_003740 [Kibdelosporangium banguiense]|uniref:ATP-grasp target RiPP n=1 Tax=Kibdelosporangium banguiense TaxID=1365924 RepID=A0ABS4TG07_9PSEU|nr:hypothetical protein [Kibdelosporangium banguiense]MBP2323355.1 hypothetical protein [Kibdelosporangium banguiense]